MTRAKYIAMAMAAALAVTGCKSHKNVMRGDEYSGEDFININIDEKAAPIVVQKDRQPGHKQSSSKSHHGNRPAAESRSVLDGEWLIVEADAFEIILDDDMPYLIFSDSGNKFYAFNGCNVLNGNFEIKGSTVTFSEVLSTMALCPGIPYESAISNVLCSTGPLGFKVEKDGNESYLYIYDKGRNQLMRLRRHNLEIINGQWSVAEIDGEEVDGDEVNVFFDLPEQKIHGNTGCNFFNGVITPDPETPSSISFANMAVTTKACPNQEIERLMLVGLEETATYSLHDNDNTLLLKDEDGNTRLKLTRQ